MKKYIDFIFGIVSIVLFEVLFAVVVVAFAIAFMPDAYNALIAENVESNVAVAILSVIGVIVTIVLYRVMDSTDKEFNNLIAIKRNEKHLKVRLLKSETYTADREPNT